jgi:CCR4-NOT transcription complex subunit 4
MQFIISRINRIKAQKKRKEREKKELDLAARNKLANVRVVQRNLIYVAGLPVKYATEEVCTVDIAYKKK